MDVYPWIDRARLRFRLSRRDTGNIQKVATALSGVCLPTSASPCFLALFTARHTRLALQLLLATVQAGGWHPLSRFVVLGQAPHRVDLSSIHRALGSCSLPHRGSRARRLACARHLCIEVNFPKCGRKLHSLFEHQTRSHGR